MTTSLPLPVLTDLQRRELYGDLMLAHAEEPTDANHGCGCRAVARQNDIVDIADGVAGVVLHFRTNELGGTQFTLLM